MNITIQYWLKFISILILILFVVYGLKSELLIEKSENNNTQVIGTIAISYGQGGPPPNGHFYLEIAENGNGISKWVNPFDIENSRILSEFKLDNRDLYQIFSVVKNNDFYNLKNEYSNLAINDGYFVLIEINQDDQYNSVYSENSLIRPLKNILSIINQVIPEEAEINM